MKDQPGPAPQSSPAAIISARDIVRTYGERRALDGLTVDVPAGGVFGLLGPNGSGKSTFMALVAGMDTPEQGELRVLGQGPARELRARLGTVFQENCADPTMRAGEYLRFAGQLFGLRGAELQGRADSLLERFGLAARGGDPVSTLSGGMRRRLEVARALLHRPELILLDEPTTGVDPDERRILWETLADNRAGATILLATNDLSEADSVCDRVAFIQNGRTIATGTPEELKRGLRRDSVQITWPGASAEDLRTVAEWPGSGAVLRDGDAVHVTTDDGAALIPRVFALAGAAIRGVRIESSTLEDAYFQYIRRRKEAQE